jgi:signal transduction protein with GAF and PtsI domain
VSADVPAVLFQLQEIIDEGIDGLVVDVMKTAQLLLGVDTHILKKESLYRDRAVIHTLSTLIDTAKNRHIPVYIIPPAHDDGIIENLPDQHRFRILKILRCLLF